MEQITNPKTDTRILPPSYLLISLIAMFVLHFLLPVMDLVSKPWVLTGIFPMALGIGMNIIADRLFSQAHTTVNSFGEPTTLITESVFQVTRNPMYLGMALVLIGVAVMLGSLSTFFVVPVFVWLITVQFIKFEEQILEDRFGLKWLVYAENVRRWV